MCPLSAPSPPTFDNDDAVGLCLTQRVGGDTAVLSGVLRLATADLHGNHAVGVSDVVLAPGQLLVALVPFHLRAGGGTCQLRRCSLNQKRFSQDPPTKIKSNQGQLSRVIYLRLTIQDQNNCHFRCRNVPHVSNNCIIYSEIKANYKSRHPQGEVTPNSSSPPPPRP